MNFVLLVISILVLISELSADHKFEVHTTKDYKSFTEHFSQFLGIFSFASVLAFISPFIIKAGFIPLALISKIISKPLMMMGLTGWVLVALTPLILARSGMTVPVFESRSQENHLFSSVSRLMSTNMSVITSETMNFFDLNNDECKLEISCRVGKRIADVIPYFQYFISQSGAANWVENKFTANMFRSMTDSKECTNICRSLNGNFNNPSDTYSSDSSDSVLEWLG